MKSEELEDFENLEIKVQELEEKISELEERLEDCTFERADFEDQNHQYANELDDFKGMLGAVPNFKDLSLFDCDNISRMVIQYFKDNGIRYEDYT